MKILTASVLALALAAAGGNAFAQSAQTLPYEGFDSAGFDDGAPGYSDGYRGDAGHYEYARVIRVVPAGAAGAYPAYGGGPGCNSRDYPGGYYPDGYAREDYYGEPRRSGSEGGRAMASILGSVIGAVIGSQVGGGSARYATTAIGSTVGAVAGRQVYENGQRERAGRVVVCDPVPASRPYPQVNGGQYDVTYEYAGRTYTTRTNYHPGDRIRVRVEVHAE